MKFQHHCSCAPVPGTVSRAAIGLCLLAALTARAQSSADSWWEKYYPSEIYESAKSAVGYGPDRDKAQELYKQAVEKARLHEDNKDDKSARRKDRIAAADLFLKAAGRWPDSAIEEDALYMAAECYYFSDQYPKATKTYDRLIEAYPNSRHLSVIDKRRFQLARYWLDLHKKQGYWSIVPNFSSDRPRFDTYGNAVKLFERIRLDDPGSQLGDDATMAAANANFESGKYFRADELYEDLRKNFPQSEHQFNAHLLGLKCKMFVYQGPQYDDKPLKDAANLLKQMYRQFPADVKQQNEYLTSVAKEVRLKQAERAYEEARFFERKGAYAAAKLYYRQLQEDYADTSLAEKAKDRGEQLASKPERASNHVQWLTNMFPDETEQQSGPLLTQNPLDLILQR